MARECGCEEGHLPAQLGFVRRDDEKGYASPHTHGGSLLGTVTHIVQRIKARRYDPKQGDKLTSGWHGGNLLLCTPCAVLYQEHGFNVQKEAAHGAHT